MCTSCDRLLELCDYVFERTYRPAGELRGQNRLNHIADEQDDIYGWIGKDCVARRKVGKKCPIVMFDIPNDRVDF